MDTFRRAFDDAFAAGDARLVINVAEVPMIDSSAIGVMMKALTSAKQRGGDVRLVNPSKFVPQTLRAEGQRSEVRFRNRHTEMKQSWKFGIENPGNAP